MMHSVQPKKTIPWYKERLETRYMKNVDPLKPKPTLNPKKWVFIKDGLDDFRDGYPPQTNGNDIIKQKDSGLGPHIVKNGEGNKDINNLIKQSALKKRFTKEEMAYLKALPLKAKRERYIEQIEKGLLSHPLALYQHLDESVDPQLFEEIVDIIDPEMNAVSDSGTQTGPTPSSLISPTPEVPELENENDEKKQNDESSCSSEDNIDNRSQSEDVKSTGEISSSDQYFSTNPFRWLPKKGEEGNEEEIMAVHEDTDEDDHIKATTAEFCNWVVNLGGSEDNNIEEATIHSLFASGYETKPALSVPIHVVELSSIPFELRTQATSNVQTPATKNKSEIPEKQSIEKTGQSEKEEIKKFQKFRYGEWYLPKRLWTKINANEPLIDPDTVNQADESETKIRSLAMDENLAKLHGANSFFDYLKRKDERVPEFLERVAKIREQELEAATQHAEGEGNGHLQVQQSKNSVEQNITVSSDNKLVTSTKR